MNQLKQIQLGIDGRKWPLNGAPSEDKNDTT